LLHHAKLQKTVNTKLESHVDASIVPRALQQRKPRPSPIQIFNDFSNIVRQDCVGLILGDPVWDSITFKERISVKVAPYANSPKTFGAAVNFQLAPFFESQLLF
jgi:hypothetical protein